MVVYGRLRSVFISPLEVEDMQVITHLMFIILSNSIMVFSSLLYFFCQVSNFFVKADTVQALAREIKSIVRMTEEKQYRADSYIVLQILLGSLNTELLLDTFSVQYSQFFSSSLEIFINR